MSQFEVPYLYSVKSSDKLNVVCYKYLACYTIVIRLFVLSLPNLWRQSFFLLVLRITVIENAMVVACKTPHLMVLVSVLRNRVKQPNVGKV